MDPRNMIMALVKLLLMAGLLTSTHAASSAQSQAVRPEPVEATALFRDLPQGPIDSDDPLATGVWNIEPDVVGVARRPSRISVVLEAGEQPVEYTVTEFEPREGFRVDDETGEIIVSDDPREVSYYWYGRNGASHVSLTVSKGIVNGLIYRPDGQLTIQGNGQEHTLREIDMAVLNSVKCRSNTIAEALKSRLAERRAADASHQPVLRAKPDDVVRVPKYQTGFTVLFYYTDAAADLLVPAYDPVTAPNAADEALNAKALLFIDEINQSIRNSGGISHIGVARLGGLVRAVDFFGNPLIETSGGSPDQRFSNYLFDLVYIERDLQNRAAAGADVAVLLVADGGNPPSDPLYGAAYTQRPNCGSNAVPGVPACGVGTNPYRGWALAAVSLAPGTANFTFSHELGHVLGNDHDIANARPVQEQSFAHSFGHRVEGVARDIMADPPCALPPATDPCPRRQQFSNPDTTFVGTSTPAGIPGGRACPDPLPPFNCPAAPHAALTIRKLVEGVGNIYPIGLNQTAPDIFWDGLEY
jgi:hypothetical protein